MHSGNLCKTNMAAAFAGTLCKVGWSILEPPVARRPVFFSYPVGNISTNGFGRAYGTSRTAVQTKLFSSVRRGRGRFLGCAFLLGGGLGLYQTLKFSIHQHLAKESSKVSLCNPVLVMEISFKRVEVCCLPHFSPKGSPKYAHGTNPYCSS